MFHAQCRELFLNKDVFFSFSCIQLLRSEILIRFGNWVADPDTKDCRSLVLPEPACMDIQSRILYFVRPSKGLGKSMGGGGGGPDHLEMWLKKNT